MLAEKSQQLLSQEPIIKSVIAQEAIEAGQSRAELDFCQTRELTGDGEVGGVCGRAECSAEHGAGLLLRKSKRS